MSKIYRAAKQSVKARNIGVYCNYRAPVWSIETRGFVLGTSIMSAKDAWINAKDNSIRGRISLVS